MSHLITIKIYNNRIEAEADKILLENSGINAAISADDCGGTHPHLAFTKGVQLLINEADLKKAAELLEIDNK